MKSIHAEESFPFLNVENAHESVISFVNVCMSPKHKSYSTRKINAEHSDTHSYKIMKVITAIMMRFIKYNVEQKKKKFSKIIIWEEIRRKKLFMIKIGWGKRKKTKIPKEFKRKGMWKSAGKNEFNTKWNQPKIVNYLSFL